MPASRGRVALVAVALLIPALLMLSPQIESARTRWGLFLILLALGAAAVLRIVWALNAAAHSEARLVFQATHDGLTGLPNRVLFKLSVEKAVSALHGRSETLAVMLLDVDELLLLEPTEPASTGESG